MPLVVSDRFTVRSLSGDFRRNDSVFIMKSLIMYYNFVNQNKDKKKIKKVVAQCKKRANMCSMRAKTAEKKSRRDAIEKFEKRHAGHRHHWPLITQVRDGGKAYVIGVERCECGEPYGRKL